MACKQASMFEVVIDPDVQIDAFESLGGQRPAYVQRQSKPRVDVRARDSDLQFREIHSYSQTRDIDGDQWEVLIGLWRVVERPYLIGDRAILADFGVYSMKADLLCIRDQQVQPKQDGRLFSHVRFAMFPIEA